MSVHLRLDGTWATCTARVRACPRQFHLPGTVQQVTAMPAELVLPLLNTIEPPSRIDAKGTMFWRDENGELHRDHDLPAYITTDGDQGWSQHGKAHREGDRPATVTELDGGAILMDWYRDDQLHRGGGKPAVIQTGQGWRNEWWEHGQEHRANGLPAYEDWAGNQEWYELGKHHRVDGPAQVGEGGDTEAWFLHGEYHRVDGPAHISRINGLEEWYLHGKRHRVGGPAVSFPGGSEWWEHGRFISKDHPYQQAYQHDS